MIVPEVDLVVESTVSSRLDSALILNPAEYDDF